MSSTCIKETTPKARKPHECGLCTETIERGEVHSAAVCTMDGTVYTFRAHLECDALAQATFHPDDWECHEPSPDFRPARDTAKTREESLT